uniref:YifB family Mg chelatase-like AAA ATPase n=1 Tax=Acetatifactor sp. TaxID=1872090 RepID=UPI0040559E16
MYSTITSGALLGVHAYLVGVEVDIAAGLPGFRMVGSLSGEVRESKERVQVALKNVGLDIPPTHITVNLSPADCRKEGTAFDLPIAVGMLQAMGFFPKEATEKRLFLGELGLNGEIRKIRGVLPIVQEAARNGIRECIVPAENAPEGAIIPDIAVRGVSEIGELLRFLQESPNQQEKILPRFSLNVEKVFTDKQSEYIYDFSEVSGQDAARRAAEIATAGFHNLLLVGPPGAGKSMIAKRIPGIMPPLTLEESLEVTAVYSVAGCLEEKEPLVTKRPFQSPHHTISLSSLSGGGFSPKPGIISLSHRGVLFLDELPEFPRAILDSMRQPLEEKQIHIARVNGNVTYPADFMLVCAMNPCPCGYYPDLNRCRCTQTQVKKYLGKISGPVLDRIDLCVELQPVQISNLHSAKKGEGSGDIRARVMKARQIQEKRFRGTDKMFNGDMDAKDIQKYCYLGEEEKKYMEQLYCSLKLSARAYHRILKVARTIADLSGAEQIEMEHLLEAACYRPVQDYWGG